MNSTFLVLVLGLAPVAQPNPTELVDQLGSPRFSVREAASESLRRMGRGALPILARAKRTGDPEIQNRAAVLIDDLERRLVLQPTLVRLTPGDERPLGRMVRELIDQTGFDLELAPGRDPHWPGRLIEVKANDPLPFWRAIEELNLDVETAEHDELRRFGIQASPAIRLRPRRDEPGPTWRDGPFRAVVRGGGRRFARATNPNLDLPAPGPNQIMPARPNRADMVVLQLDLQAEPRLAIHSTGPIKLLEATGPDGQSLLPTDPNLREQPVVEDAIGRSSPSISLAVVLGAPAKPVDRLARLRVQVSIEAESRRIEPLEFPIQEEESPNPRPFWSGDLSLKVLRTTKHAGLGVTTIEILAMPQGWNELQIPNLQRRRFELIARDFDRLRKSLEVVGADGQPIKNTGIPEGRFAPDGIHLILNVPVDAIPTRIRYHGTIQEVTDLTIDLRDVPLPSLD